MPKDANQTVSKYDKDAIFLKTNPFHIESYSIDQHFMDLNLLLKPKMLQNNFVQIRKAHSKTRSFSLRAVL